MDEGEVLILIVSCVFTVIFVVQWYGTIYSNSAFSKPNKITRCLLSVVPPAAFLMIFFTLKEWAAFDVVGDGIYIVLYIFGGFASISLIMKLMFKFFDLSWKEDAIFLDNKAAAIAIVSGFFGATIIYCGANIGDGPGWLCVVFAGALGFIGWFMLGKIILLVTSVSERITVERNVSSSIRFCGYMLANAIVLGRASGGDWHSVTDTIKEFEVGWPALVLTGAAIIIELIYENKDKNDQKQFRRNTLNKRSSSWADSIFIGALFIGVAVYIVTLLPSII